jgi:hypothetical protein
MKCFGRIYFCLIFNGQTDEEKMELLNELINKGDQVELDEFKKDNKILFFNEDSFEEEFFMNHTFKPMNLLKEYTKKDKYSKLEITIPTFNIDETQFVEDIINKKDPGKFKCFIL